MGPEEGLNVLVSQKSAMENFLQVQYLRYKKSKIFLTTIRNQSLTIHWYTKKGNTRKKPTKKEIMVINASHVASGGESLLSLSLALSFIFIIPAQVSELKNVYNACKSQNNREEIKDLPPCV